MRKILIAIVVLMMAGSVLYAQDRPPRPDRPRGEEPRVSPERVAQMERELAQLLRKAEAAEKAGRKEEALELLGECEKLLAEIDRLSRHLPKDRPRGERPERRERRGERERPERPERREREKPEFPPEFEGKLKRARNQIEKLHREAAEAKERGEHDKARELMERAHKIEKQIAEAMEKLKGDHRPDDEKPPFPPEIMERIERARHEIAKMHRTAEEAAENGNEERARKLHERAEAMERELMAYLEKLKREHSPKHDRPHKEKEWLERAKREIEELQEAARDAKEEGHHDKARKLWNEAEQLKRKLAEAMKKHDHDEKPEFPPELAEKIDGMRHEIEKLRDKAHEAKERGHHDKAEQCWKEAEKLERKLKEMMAKHHGKRPEKPSDDEIANLKRKIEHLREQAHALAEKGHKDKAHELHKQAEELEQHLRKLTGHHKKPRHEGGELKGALEDVRREREEIMHELEKLKKHLHELERMEEELKRELGKRDK